MPSLTAITNRLGNRACNQDRCTFITQAEKTLMIVADGMGGHARGELAAQIAVTRISQLFNQHTGSIDDPHAFLANAIQQAHQAIITAGQQESPPVDPRTVCVVCIVQNGHAWWAHVGDSRLYFLRFDQVVKRTRDHTPLEALYANGKIDAKVFNTHPLRNSVNRCMGGNDRQSPAISFDDSPLKSGDVLLLCSDGLWSALPERQLFRLNTTRNLAATLDKLAMTAETQSYPNSDNISAVVMRWFPDTAVAEKTGLKKTKQKQKAFTDDPLQSAIDEINQVMIDYADEMKK
ncbi:MAG: PP2C family serine/threonine-protein phosphatase [Gammaproteobacteria bacterium]